MEHGFSEHLDDMSNWFPAMISKRRMCLGQTFVWALRDGVGDPTSWSISGYRYLPPTVFAEFGVEGARLVHFC